MNSTTTNEELARQRMRLIISLRFQTVPFQVMKSKFYSSLHLPFNPSATKQTLLCEMLRAVDCQAMTDTQWDALFGGSLLRWLELKHSSLFQYMFESHMLSPAHRDEVNQTYNQMAEFNTFQQLLQHNNSDLPSVSSFPPNLSPEQLRSADCLSGDDQEDSASSDSSGALLHLDLNTLEENCQDTYAFLQSSPLGMDHPESFMDPDTDIIRGSFSDSEVSNPSPTYFYEVLQKPQKHFFPEDISTSISPRSSSPPNITPGTSTPTFISPYRTHTFISFSDPWQQTTSSTAPSLSPQQQTAAACPTIPTADTQFIKSSRNCPTELSRLPLPNPYTIPPTS